MHHKHLAAGFCPDPMGSLHRSLRPVSWSLDLRDRGRDKGRGNVKDRRGRDRGRRGQGGERGTGEERSDWRGGEREQSVRRDGREGKRRGREWEEKSRRTDMSKSRRLWCRQNISRVLTLQICDILPR